MNVSRFNLRSEGFLKRICFILLSLNVVFFLAEIFSNSTSGPLSDEALRKSVNPLTERLILLREIENPEKSKQSSAHTKDSDSHETESVAKDGLQNAQSSDNRDPSSRISVSNLLSGLDDSGEHFEEMRGLCFQLGPLRSIKTLLPLLELFKDRRVVHLIRSDTFEEESSFFVYYPLNEADQAAGAAIRMLLDKGARDLWRIDRGELRGNISLGVFNTRTRAQVLRLELEAKGIQSKIYAKRLKKPGYSLRFGWPDSIRELESLLLITGLEGQKLAPVEYESCAL